MREVETESYPIQIWVAGDFAKAMEVCRSYCDETGFCVSVSQALYIYTGGQESGVVVGLINYGRFPTTGPALLLRARAIAMRLLDGMGQESCSIQANDKTIWISRREGDE